MIIPPDHPRLTPVVTRKEFVSRGLTDRMIGLAVRSGELASPRRGAYVDGLVWASLDDVGRHAVRAHAAYRQSRTEVVLSHATALPFLDAPTWGIDLTEVHITREDARTGRREAGVRQHSGKLAGDDVTDVHGLRVSAPIRAALETITIAPLEAALIVTNHFLHRGDFTLEQLVTRYEEGIERWPHTLTAPLVFRLADGRVESVAESRTLHLVWSQQLPRPVLQHEVIDGRGVLLGRLDFAWPELGVWLEFDGKQKYLKHLREGESITDAVLREKRREEQIRELTGWICVRITWADLAQPGEVARRMREAIARAAAARHAAGRRPSA